MFSQILHIVWHSIFRMRSLNLLHKIFPNITLALTMYFENSFMSVALVLFFAHLGFRH